MADPQTADQGFLAGLLGKFGADPAAAYGGLLSDPATQRQFALRSLGAAAQAFGQGAMPVPYKGGIPFGATLGAAGGAASTAGDELIKARLEQAQQEQALASVGLSHQQVELMQAALPGLKSLIATGQAGLGAGGSGTGTAPPGTPAALTGVGAGPRGVQAGGISPTDHYSFLLDNGASKNEATMLTSAANSESSFRPDLTHDHGIGYGLYGHNTDRLAAMRTFAGVGPNDPVPWQQQALFALAELRGQVPGLPGGGEPKAGAMVNAATNAQQLTDAQLAFERPNLNIAGGNRAQRLASTTEYLNKPPYAQSPTQTASAGDQPPAAAPGSQVGPYAPVPGQPPPQGVYVPPGASPNAPPVRIEGGPPAPAAPPGGLLKLPDPTSAAPPQLATPPATGAPGPAAAAASPTLGLLAAQQGGGEVGSPLGAASPQIASVPSRGLLAQVAGPGAAEPSAPPAAVTQQAGPPHTGAAGAAELAGLLAQQPAPAGPATATPYTNAPPVTGQGAQAPGPVSSPPAPSVPMRQGPAPIGPPPQLPPMPTQMPASGNLPNVQPTPQQMIAQGVSGLMSMSGHPAPGWIDDLAKMPAQMALEQFKAWVGAQTTMMTARDAEMVKARMAPYIAAAEAAARAQQEGVRPNRLFPQPDGTFRQAPGEPYHRPGPPDIYGNPTEVMVYPSGDPNVPEKVVSIPGTTGQGTYRTEEEKASAARDAALADRFTTQGVAANDIRPTISMAKSILANTPTGIGAPYQAALNEMLAKVSGNPALAEKTGNYQQLASQLAEVRRGMMQGEPQGDLKAIPGEFASVGTSPQALPRMLSDISGMADYRAARLQAMTQYADPKIHPENQGSTRGFASWWSQNFNPYAFMLNRMDPNERATALYRIGQQPGGHQEIDRIVAQDRLGRSWGYIPNLGPGQ